MTQLEWGQTPWDKLPRAELLAHLQRLYSAAESLYGSLYMVSQLSREDPYFTQPHALGYKALAKGSQALAAARLGHSDEDITRAFFRYADDLLFEAPVGAGWLIDEAGQLTAVGRAHAGLYHNAHARTANLPHLMGFLRRITWKDLEPKV